MFTNNGNGYTLTDIINGYGLKLNECDKSKTLYTKTQQLDGDIYKYIYVCDDKPDLFRVFIDIVRATPEQIEQNTGERVKTLYSHTEDYKKAD